MAQNHPSSIVHTGLPAVGSVTEKTRKLTGERELTDSEKAAEMLGVRDGIEPLVLAKIGSVRIGAPLILGSSIETLEAGCAT